MNEGLYFLLFIVTLAVLLFALLSLPRFRAISHLSNGKNVILWSDDSKMSVPISKNKAGMFVVGSKRLDNANEAITEAERIIRAAGKIPGSFDLI